MTQSAQHTPGPWQVDEDASVEKGAHEFRLSANGGEKYLGYLCDGASSVDLIRRGYLPLEEARANAALVVAAPGLLAACEAALKSLEWNLQWLAGEDAALVSRDIKIIKDAIALARKDRT
jgi:hypothetical protein